MHLPAFCAALLGVMLTALAVPAAASERFSFSSRSFTEPTLSAVLSAALAATRQGKLQIQGTLDMPAKAAGPVPAVVLLHTSGGLRDSEANVAGELNRAGIAAVYFESYGPRNMGNVAGGGGPQATVYQASDAYGAVKALAFPAIN
jgi:hypothetical protein